MALKKDLEERGFLYQFTNEKLFDLYEKGGQSFYVGFDPSSDSLQLGNLCAMMAAVNLMKKGNKCYFLVGGATGMIGDPSEKDSERNFLGEEQLRYNEKCIYEQLKNFLDNLSQNYGLKLDFTMVNNFDFYKDMTALEFLAKVGKYITVNYMSNKDSVKKRLVDPDKSISYTEFTYMLIQGYDFARLFDDEGVKLQLGGSDQRGNITTGIELVRKKYDGEAYGLTIPLVTDSSGKKFGKSEGNAIWLNPAKNSPYFAYQYFLNTNDEDVEKYLKILTLLEISEIEEIVEKHDIEPSKRYGQKRLADYIVKLIFGKEALEQAQNITKILFESDDRMSVISGLSSDDILALKKETGGIDIEIPSEGLRLLDLCTQSGLTSSNGEAKKMIQNGVIFCNEDKVEDVSKILMKDDLVNGIFLLRRGKKLYRVVVG